MTPERIDAVTTEWKTRAPTAWIVSGFDCPGIIAEACDLIESRSPELAAAARTALRRYNDEVPRQAE